MLISDLAYYFLVSDKLLLLFLLLLIIMMMMLMMMMMLQEPLRHTEFMPKVIIDLIVNETILFILRPYMASHPLNGMYSFLHISYNNVRYFPF